MGNVNIKVAQNGVEIASDRIGTLSIPGGRKHVTVLNPRTGDKENVGLLNSDGSVDPDSHPGYEIEVA